MVGPSSFRKKQAFCTYQHLERAFEKGEDTLKVFYAWFQEKFPLKSVTVGFEDYPTEEGFHAHVFLEFNNTYYCPTALFTYEGIIPYFETVTNAKASRDNIHKYCIKDGLFLSNRTGDSDEVKEDHFRKAILSTSRAEASSYIQEHLPRTYICSYNNVQAFLDGHFRGVNTDYVAPQDLLDWKVPDEIEEWFEANFEKVS